MRNMNESSTPICVDCQHYFVTWDSTFPRGCRAFKIKTKRMPALEVRDADGRNCLQFLAKKT